MSRTPYQIKTFVSLVPTPLSGGDSYKGALAVQVASKHLIQRPIHKAIIPFEVKRDGEYEVVVPFLGDSKSELFTYNPHLLANRTGVPINCSGAPLRSWELPNISGRDRNTLQGIIGAVDILELVKGAFDCEGMPYKNLSSSSQPRLTPDMTNINSGNPFVFMNQGMTNRVIGSFQQEGRDVVSHCLPGSERVIRKRLS